MTLRSAACRIAAIRAMVVGGAPFGVVLAELGAVSESLEAVRWAVLRRELVRILEAGDVADRASPTLALWEAWQDLPAHTPMNAATAPKEMR